jgi:serine/threonine-protein kinase
VDRALQLAPDLVEAHMALGDYHYYGRLDYDRALEQYLWVQRRQPGNSDAAALIAWIQRRQGDWESSIINAERALELDPRNTVWVAGQAQNYFYTRQYALAESYFQRAIALAADVPYYHRWAAWLYLTWDGTTDRAYRLLQRAFYRIDPAQLLVGSEASWIILNVFGADYAPTLERLAVDEPGIDSAYYYLAKAHVNSRTGQPAAARAYYDSARVVLEARLGEGPQHLAPHNALGIALAGLGEREAAIYHGQLGVQRLSVSRDGVIGPNRVLDLARIYVMVGEHEAAIDQIQYLLSIPAPMSAALLRVDPFWDPLRSYARFQALVEMERPEVEGEESTPTRRTVTRTSATRT